MTSQFEITVNGESHSFAAPMSLTELLEALGLQGRRVAIEVNQGIVPRSQHATHRLKSGDQIEIIQAIGGG